MRRATCKTRGVSVGRRGWGQGDGDTDLHASHRSRVRQSRLQRCGADAAPGTPPCRALQLEVHFPGTKANTAGTGLKGAAGQHVLLLAPSPSLTWLRIHEPTVAQQEWGDHGEGGLMQCLCAPQTPQGAPMASAEPALRCQGAAGMVAPWGGRTGKPRQPPCPTHVPPLPAVSQPCGVQLWGALDPGVPTALGNAAAPLGDSVPLARTQRQLLVVAVPWSLHVLARAQGPRGACERRCPVRGCTECTDPCSIPLLQPCP